MKLKLKGANVHFLNWRRGVILILGLLFLSQSCKKSINEESSDPPALSGVKEWFNNQQGGTLTRSTILSSLVPDWSHVEKFETEFTTVYEVELKNPNRIFLTTDKIDLSNAESYANKSIFKLIIAKNKKSNLFTGRYMNVVSESDTRTNVHYNNVKGFTGNVIFLSLSSNVQSVDSYSKGRIDKNVYGEKVMLNSREKLSVSYTDCQISAIPAYGQFCFQLDGFPSYCSWQIMGFTYSVHCVASDAPMGEDDGGLSQPPLTPPDVTPPSIEDPCARKAMVSAVVNNSYISSKNAEARTATSATGNEYGYEQRVTQVNGSTYINIPIRTDGSTNSFNSYFTWDSTNGYTIGDTHTHPAGSAPSPTDVFGMAVNLNKQALLNSGPDGYAFYTNNVSITVVTAATTYVVTVKDWSGFQSAYAAFQADPTMYNYSFATLAQNGGTEKALLTKLGNVLNVYKKIDGEMKPLAIDENGDVSPIDCPPN